MKEKHVVILLSIAVVILAVLSGMCVVMQDRKAPVITIPEEEITYVEGKDKAILMEDVTAWDDRDKDVTSCVRVDSIIPDKGGKTAVVVYAAYDESNNIVKAKRVVKYQANQENVNSDDGESTEEETEETNASDEADEEGSDDAQEESETESEDEDEEADEQQTDVTDVQPNGSSPTIRLGEYEFRIEKGGDFTPLNRVAAAVDDKDDRATLFRRFTVEGDYDVNVPGTYTLKYFCMDSDGNVSNVETLTLVVEENLTP